MSISVQTEEIFSHSLDRYKCTDCGFLYAIANLYSLEEALDLHIGAKQYCLSCFYNRKFLPAERIPTSNPYDLGFWRKINVLTEDFYCCRCKRADYFHKLSSHSRGFIILYFFVHYSSHRLCHFCFRDAVTLRRDIFNPKKCCLLTPE